MKNTRKFPHQVEVRSHLICQPCHLAKLRNQSNFLARLPVLTNNQWLVRIPNRNCICVLVVVHEACLDLFTFFAFHESASRRFLEIDLFNLVRVLLCTVSSHNAGILELIIDLIWALAFVLEILQYLVKRVSSNDFIGQVNLNKASRAEPLHGAEETRPDFELLDIDGLAWVEHVAAIALEAHPAHDCFEDDGLEGRPFKRIVIHALSVFELKLVILTIMLARSCHWILVHLC